MTSASSASGASATTSSALAFFFVGIVARSIDGSRDCSIAEKGDSAIAVKEIPVRRRGPPNPRGGRALGSLAPSHRPGCPGKQHVLYSTPRANLRLSQHVPTCSCAAALRRFCSVLRGVGDCAVHYGNSRVVSSRSGRGSLPGGTAVVPGQWVADFSDRRRSARRSDSRRSRSVAPWSTNVIASARARWPATSAIALCICCATRRYAGCPWAPERSSMRCMASRALNCMT